MQRRHPSVPGNVQTRHRRCEVVGAIRLVGGALVLAAAAVGCTRPVSTNTVEVLNLTEGTVEIRSDVGEQEPRELPPRTETVYLVPREGCMGGRLVAHDEDGNILAETDRPCGGTRWVVEGP
jgi:hypothetical protein